MKILSIDDNLENRFIIENGLQADFDVVSDDGNTDIWELMSTHAPDIVLVDIVLENKTGYELVEQLRGDMEYDDVYVIFVSSLNDSDDKRKAYAAGGQDYICKPVDLAELSLKLKNVLEGMAEKKQLKEQFSAASTAAFTSMQQASELGQLVNFLTESLNIVAMDKLYENVRQYFQGYGLNCAMEFRVDDHFYHFSPQILTTLEFDILELGRDAKRIVPFGDNILFNSIWCSLLVKRLPQEEELLGRLRDNFAIMLSILDSRLMFIDSEIRRQQERKKAVRDLEKKLTSDFEEIKALCLNQEQKIQDMSNRIVETLNLKVITLGLDEEQESDIVHLIDDTKELTEDAVGLSPVIEDKLIQINNLLKNIH